jgi:phosphomannomutase
MTATRFGTDGWRAITGDGFTLAGVRLAAQAIARRLTDAGRVPGTGPRQPAVFNLNSNPGGTGHQGLGAGRGYGLVIGYDNRFRSERFSAAATEVMAGNGIQVWLTSAATPTPVTAFAVKNLAADGALVITAGHNPQEYNGIKFITEYAGTATPEITAAIEHDLGLLSGTQEACLLPLDAALKRGLVKVFDPKPAYLTAADLCRGRGRGLPVPAAGERHTGVGDIEGLGWALGISKV